MSGYQVIALTPAYLPQVMALQEAYRQRYPHATVIPGEIYLSPTFDAGANIYCAVDEDGCLRAYAPLLPTPTAEPGLPNVIWVEVKADPALARLREIKDLLFERVAARARKIASCWGEKPAQLTFQYHPTESVSIDYVRSKGAACTATVYRMLRDLSAEIPEAPCPEGIDVRYWRMQTETEQREYVAARNEALPDSPVSLEDWQSFLLSGPWREGCVVTALDGPHIAGCVAAYCDDRLSQDTGTRAGVTEYIFVRSKWRGRGIASHLIARSLHWLRERGRDAAYLEVKASNENALALYRRSGYQIVDETRLYALEL